MKPCKLEPAKLATGVLLVFAGVPFLIWLPILYRYGVPLPIQDQWDTPYHAMVEAFSGRFNLGTYWVQHNEARKVLPSAISVTLALILGHWNTQAEVYLGFFLCLGLVYLLRRLACATSGFKRCDRAFLVFVFSWLLWSPLTWYFHTWGITFERLLPEAALLGGVLWFLLRHSISTLQALGFSALAAIGQYSFSGGVALYPLFGLLLLSDAVSRRTLKPLLTYSALASLFIALYFAGYRHPAGHTPLLAVLDQPLTSVFGFFLTVLGRSFSEEPHLAACMGGLNLGLYALGTVRAWQADRHDRTAWAWMLIGGYALMQALLATIGRLPMGMGHALRPDYVTYGTYLLVAGIALLQKAPLKAIKHLGPILSTAMTGIAYVHTSALEQMHTYHYRLLAEKSCLQLKLVFPGEYCQLTTIYPHPELLLLKAKTASKLGVLAFPSITVQTQAKGGFVDRYQAVSGGVQITGWAVAAGKEADAVVFALAKNTGCKLLGVLPTGHFRPDVAQTVGRNFAFAGWSGVLPVSIQEIGALRAYAFSENKGLLVPINWLRPDPPSPSHRPC
jgi:hypothetical protein